jgi:serine/threonine-protein kinase
MDSTDRDRRIEGLFDRFVDDHRPERLKRLEDACAGDTALFMAVSALLDADVAAVPILDAGAAVLASTLLEASERPSIPGRFGRYVILQHIDDGGMGSVYLAEREGLGDQVAVKFLHDPWSSPARRRRFASEQRMLAALKHPGIARLYDAGVEDDRPWFAMEYVPGRSIVQHCKAESLPCRQRLLLFRDACQAVAYAHRNLTVHLDL